MQHNMNVIKKFLYETLKYSFGVDGMSLELHKDSEYKKKKISGTKHVAEYKFQRRLEL
jgi:hypothetical protein